MGPLDLIGEWFKGMGWEPCLELGVDTMFFEAPAHPGSRFVITLGGKSWPSTTIFVGWIFDGRVKGGYLPMDIHSPEFFDRLYTIIKLGPMTLADLGKE